jgi:hypothetical protein
MTRLSWLAYWLVFAFSSSCAAHDNPLLSSGPDPRVEDCALIQQATPSKYVCAGKTYTAVELSGIRAGQPLK